MNPAEWSRARHPEPMLEYLAFRGDERRLRLFAVACCRRIWELFPNEACQRAVEVSEQYADRVVDGETLLDAHAGAVQPVRHGFLSLVFSRSLSSVGWHQIGQGIAVKVSLPGMHTATIAEMTVAICDAIKQYPYRWDSWFGWGKEPRMQAALLRDIFDPLVTNLTCEVGMVSPLILDLAAAAYDERDLPSPHLDTGRLGVLADALEESGCMSADLLAHLRTPGPHIRGCWALDQVLAGAQQ
jgi:hypothetical protein